MTESFLKLLYDVHTARKHDTQVAPLLINRITTK